MSCYSGRNGQGASPGPLIVIAASYDLVREMLSEWLSARFPDCRCVTTSTGAGALAIACAEHPHLVILELDVPDSGGAEALRTIGRACPRAHLVVVSEHAAEVNRIWAETASAGSCVCKHGIDAELPPLISTLLQRSP